MDEHSCHLKDCIICRVAELGRSLTDPTHKRTLEELWAVYDATNYERKPMKNEHADIRRAIESVDNGRTAVSDCDVGYHEVKALLAERDSLKAKYDRLLESLKDIAEYDGYAQSGDLRTIAREALLGR